MKKANTAFDWAGKHIEVGDIVDDAHVMCSLFPTRFTTVSVTGLLAVVSNVTGGSKATTSTTQADVDATNALITFTAPSTLNVLVRATLTANISAANNNSYLGLREGTSNLVNGAVGTVFIQGQAATALEFTSTWAAYLAGISAGAHTYKLAFAVDGGATFTIREFATTPMTLEVWAAP